MEPERKSERDTEGEEINRCREKYAKELDKPRQWRTILLHQRIKVLSQVIQTMILDSDCIFLQV